jgi:hypothetical protein
MILVGAYLNCFIFIIFLCCTRETHFNLDTEVCAGGSSRPRNHVVGIGLISTRAFSCILKLIAKTFTMGFLSHQFILKIIHVSILWYGKRCSPYLAIQRTSASSHLLTWTTLACLSYWYQCFQHVGQHSYLNA